MLFYFYGDDTYQARQAIADLAAEGHATIRWLDKEEAATRPLAEVVGQSQGLFGRYLPVLRDVSTWPVVLQEAALNSLERATAPSVLWDRLAPDKRSSLFKRLKPHAREFPRSSPAALISWLHAEAGNRHGKIDAPAARLLIEHVGPDRWRLLIELEKLLLAADTVTVAEVSEHVPAAASAEIFPALDALAQRDQATALKNIESLLDSGHGELYVLSMLAWQFRILLLVKRGSTQNLSAAAIAKTHRLHPFVVEKNLTASRAWSASELLEALTAILASDFAIKQGKTDARTALLLLVLRLSQTSNRPL